MCWCAVKKLLTHSLTLGNISKFWVKDDEYLQKWHLQYKTSDISETKQSGAKVTIECLWKLAYGLSIGDKSGDLGWTWTTFPGAIFFTRDISYSFLSKRNEIWQSWGSGQGKLTPRTSWNLVQGSRANMRWHASVIYWRTCKWFFDNFPMFADSFRLVSIHCVAQD